LASRNGGGHLRESDDNEQRHREPEAPPHRHQLQRRGFFGRDADELTQQRLEQPDDLAALGQFEREQGEGAEQRGRGNHRRPNAGHPDQARQDANPDERHRDDAVQTAGKRRLWVAVHLLIADRDLVVGTAVRPHQHEADVGRTAEDEVHAGVRDRRPDRRPDRARRLRSAQQERQPQAQKRHDQAARLWWPGPRSAAAGRRDARWLGAETRRAPSTMDD
jgi:hypothetical protein